MLDKSKKLIGARILAEANDIKRTLSILADELSVDTDFVSAVCNGEASYEDQFNLVMKMADFYPIDPYKILFKEDDTDKGIKLMRSDQSSATSRVISRKCIDSIESPYYEYRDTSMSLYAPFRPEWIRVLRYIDDSNPYNENVIYNKGHFLHQNTFFIGPVNFYYEIDGIKYCEEMSTGDSNYITPFIPHSFATRSSSELALIIAVTYAGEVSNSLKDLYLMGESNIKKIYIPNKRKNEAIANMVLSYLDDDGITPDQFSHIYNFNLDTLISKTKDKPRELIESFANILDIPPSDLDFPEYDEKQEVVVHRFSDSKGYIYPNNANPYCFLTPLAKSKKMKNVKMFDIKITGELENKTQAFETSLHSYLFHYSGDNVVLRWVYEDVWFEKELSKGDSLYLKPYVKFFFEKDTTLVENPRLLMIRVPGSITRSVQKELSMFSSSERVIESCCWF